MKFTFFSITYFLGTRKKFSIHQVIYMFQLLIMIKSKERLITDLKKIINKTHKNLYSKVKNQ